MRGRRPRTRAHDDPAFDAEPDGDGFAAGNDADAGRGHAPIADELGHGAIDDVDRDGKADPGIRPRRREDRRVHADEPPGRIEQRTARIAGIDRGVGLDDVADLPAAAGGQPPLQRAYDAVGKRLVEPERIADRKGGLPDLEVRRAPDRDRLRKIVHAGEPNDREIVMRRKADVRRLDGLSRCQTYRKGFRPLHDMVIGDDVAGLVPDESGAGSDFRLIGGRRRRLVAAAAADDVDHRWRNALEDFDGRFLIVREAPARLDLTRRGRRIELILDVGPDRHADQDDQQQHHDIAERPGSHICLRQICDPGAALRSSERERRNRTAASRFSSGPTWRSHERGLEQCGRGQRAAPSRAVPSISPAHSRSFADLVWLPVMPCWGATWLIFKTEGTTERYGRAASASSPMPAITILVPGMNPLGSARNFATVSSFKTTP